MQPAGSLNIKLVSGRPPSGVVVRDEGTAVPFTGWLALIQALSEAFEEVESNAPAS